jgi:transformation/transcription domain-associated protein
LDQWAGKCDSVSIIPFFLFKFHQFFTVELDANRPVPFRLTSNISHFLAPSIEGHLNGALTAIARSFSARSLECWLRPILWDVFVKVAAEDGNDQQMANIANPVKRAVDTILGRIKAISNNENGVGPTSNLLIQAQLPDNLCRMDPNFHPWF